jgi:hypothetical protein
VPVFELELDDGRKLHIDADSQEAALAGYKHFQETEGAPKAPSGFLAGAAHGAEDLVHGDAATLKSFAGVGNGAPAPDANYVPANITNGSVNPLTWNYSQIPQKVAENAPGLGQDVVAGTVAAKAAKSAGIGLKGSALAGLIGGLGSAWTRSAGDTAKSVAVNRTGDSNAEPATQDLVRGGVTAAAAALPAAIPATRFIPGLNKVTAVGGAGVLDAIKKYLATTATGAGGAAASDAITQAGTTGTIDPSRTLEAAAGGLVTGGTLAAPRGLADAKGAVGLRQFGGDNLEATKNYATRLQTAGEASGLGNTFGGGKADAAAHATVKADIQNELRDAASNVRKQVQLSPEADNALQRAQNGENITPQDLAHIDAATAGAPDGANAAHLARTMQVAQMAEGRGSYSKDGWSGGVSGAMDKQLGFLLNPMRLAAGSVATGLGMQLLGVSNPAFALSAAGGYGAARTLDSLTGARSPAKMFAERFADQQNAALRMPQTQPPAAPGSPPGAPGPAQPWGPVPPLQTGPTGPAVPPPGAPSPAQASPWGPRPPMTGPTGPSVPPPAPPAPAAPQAPAINPMALAMLKQKLKAGLPAETAPVAPAPEPAPQTPAISPLALQMLKQKLKAGLPPQAEPQAAPAPAAPIVNPSPAAPALPGPDALLQSARDAQKVPTDVSKNSKLLMAGLAKVAKMKSAAESAQVKPPNEIPQMREIPSDWKFEVTPRRAHMMEDAPSERVVTLHTADGKPAYEATLINHDDGYAISPVHNVSGGVVKGFGPALYTKMAQWAASQGKKLYTGASESTSYEAQKVQEKLRSAGMLEDVPGKDYSAVKAVPDKSTAPASKITKKANGKVESTAQAPAADGPFEPLPENLLYPPDISAKAYAAREAGEYGIRSPKYMLKAEHTAQQRIDAATEVKSQHPQYKHAVDGLVRQLHRIGSNPVEVNKAVNHYASLLPPEAGKALKDAFGK